jgi:hypothetical protein
LQPTFSGRINEINLRCMCQPMLAAMKNQSYI